MKIDYENVWKELKEYFYEMAKSENRKHQEYNVFGLNHFNMMKNYESKYTKEIIELLPKADPEDDDCILGGK